MQKTKICICCEREKTVEKFRLTKEWRGRMCSACIATRQRAQLRLELFAAFDWKCSCCGEGHPQFLSLEHIHGVGSGNSYRHKIGLKSKQSYLQIYQAKRENWDKTKYELLCMNCNFAKGHFGQCPHRSGI